MRLRNFCFGLILALGLPAQQAGAAVVSSLTVTADIVGGLACATNTLCYIGEPRDATFAYVGGPRQGAPFLVVRAASDGTGLRAVLELNNVITGGQAELDLRSTDVYVLDTLNPAGPATVDVTARLTVGGIFLGGLLGEFATGTGMVRSLIRPTSAAATVLDSTDADKTQNVTLNRDLPSLGGGRLPNIVDGLVLPSIDLRVETGRPFPLEFWLNLGVGISSVPADQTGGYVNASFINSALVSFDLPDGYFITSERGYAQGLPHGPADPIGPAVIPLPAGGLLLLSALGLLRWASRRRPGSRAA